MLQAQIPLGGMPINLVLLSNGCIVFVKTCEFGVLFDYPEAGLQAIFQEDHFRIGEEEYEYNWMYPYKTMPNLLAYLQQQNLIEPQWN